MEEIAAELLSHDERRRAAFEARGSARFAVSVPGLSRFRVSLFRQRGSPAAGVRVLGRGAPDLEGLFPDLPEVREGLSSLALSGGGLVVAAGPAGSGKTSTLAAMVDFANRKRAVLIVTVEDPIEHLHAHAASVVSQREVGEDAESVAAGVAEAAAAGADLIMAGDVPDAAAAEAVVAAAEAGRLVLCAARAGSLEEALFALPDLAGSAGARARYAAAVRAVVFQKAVPASGCGRTVAAGVYLLSRAARLALRSGDREGAVAAARGAGAGCPLERSLARLAAAGKVRLEDAEEAAEDAELFWRYMRLF